MKKVIFVISIMVLVAGICFSQTGRDFTTAINGSRNGVIITGYRGSVTHVDIPAEIEGLPVTEISRRAFRRNNNIVSITIPGTATIIGAEAFAGCRSLTSVTMPNSVTEIGESLFEGSGRITNVILSESLTSIPTGTFKDCSSLVSVNIPSSVRSFGESVLEGCESLVSITLPPAIRVIPARMFYGATRLAEVNLNEGLTRRGEMAFVDTKGLVRLNLPNSLTHIDDVAFMNSGLTEIIFPNSMLRIGAVSFSGSNVGKVQFPNHNNFTLGALAFAGCRNLTSVTIPENVTNIIFEQGITVRQHGAITDAIGLVARPTLQNAGSFFRGGRLDLASQAALMRVGYRWDF